MRTSEIEQLETASTRKAQGMHPKKFAMWIFMVSVTMIFASLTSAYLVRQAEPDWDIFSLPPMFGYSTAVILLSSVTMHWAYLAAKRDNLSQVRSGLLATGLLGLVFLWMQWEGWKQMVGINVYFSGNPAGSFVYVLSGLHGAHIVSALIFLGIVIIQAFRLQVHAKKLLQINLCTTYWHFLDLTWVYLFVFLLLNR